MSPGSAERAGPLKRKEVYTAEEKFLIKEELTRLHSLKWFVFVP